MERTGSEDDLKTTDGQVSDQQDSASSSLKGTASVVDLSLEGGRQSSVVTARGTADGLVIRLDGRVECDSLRGAINDFLSERKSFVGGQAVSLEWIGAEPDSATLDLVTEDLRANYSIKVKSSEVRMVAVGKTTSSKRTATEPSGDKKLANSPKKMGLFGGIEGFDIGSDNDSPAASDSSLKVRSMDSARQSDSRARSAGSRSAAAQPRVYDPTLWDDADTRLICKTLRSGQKIETEHSLLIVGDVNSGAELVAGGDIIVIGALRGVAHAGAFDETGGGRFIFALDLEPTQLRIGAIISRGAQGDSDLKSHDASGAEIARVDGNIIVVEPYAARTVTALRR